MSLKMRKNIVVAAKATSTALYACTTKAVVARAFFGVAQHIIGLSGFLEFLLGLGIIRVVVGVKL